MRSGDGAITLTDAVPVPFLGGTLRFENMTLRPPSGEQGADAVFGLGVEHLELGKLATTFGWPAFRGELTGRLPRAHYANERLDFEGGLSLAMFDGRVDVSSLSMERPFGVAPTLAADLAIEDLDLLALTEVFDFGSISGRLDGRIDALRLVDWTVTAFDADLHTDPTRRTRQRISQRAVQSISSVGDSSIVSSLQGQLIGLFDDFGYKRIGIGCQLANEVCHMRGLRFSRRHIYYRRRRGPPAPDGRRHPRQRGLAYAGGAPCGGRRRRGDTRGPLMDDATQSDPCRSKEFPNVRHAQCPQKVCADRSEFRRHGAAQRLRHHQRLFPRGGSEGSGEGIRRKGHRRRTAQRREARQPSPNRRQPGGAAAWPACCSASIR